jgi:ParB family transcriptional regulator, chromosome partitioning protein
MQDAHDLWAERLPGDPDVLFDWCLDASQDTLLELLAYCSALSVNAVRTPFDRDTSPRLRHADRLGNALGLDMAAQWKPSAESFYGRLTKATLLHIVEEAKAPLPVRIADVKRNDAARYVAKALEGKGWLPVPLRPLATPTAA